MRREPLHDGAGPGGGDAPGRLERLHLHVMDSLASSMFVAMLAPDGRVLEVNQNALNAAGLTLQDVQDRPFEETYWWSYSGAAMSRLRRDIERVAAGASVRYDVEARIAGGGFLWIDFAMHPVRDEAGAVAFIVASGSDITGRKQIEVSLREASDRLEAAVRAGRVGLWEWWPATNAVSFSPQWKRQLGYDEHEIANTMSELLDRLHPDERESAQAYMRAFIAGDAADFEMEFRLRHRNGSYRIILSRGQKIVDEHTGQLRLVGSHVDITEHVELGARLLQAQKLESVGRLAGGIAHDFNNLITVINAAAELAMMQLGADDPLRAELRQIHEAGDRAAALTRQLLAFSRRQLLKPTVLDLGEVVRNLEGMLRRLLGETVTLEVRLAPRLGSVSADRGQIEQVLMNLAINARDAMPDGGTLTIETREERVDATDDARRGVVGGAYVVLTVADTGLGMDDATQQRIFEPFFTTKEAGRGTGLGLATVHGIVEQSGGRIVVQSEPGKGARFHILLPRVDATPSTEVRAPRGLVRGSGMVLVVEDEPALRKTAGRVLRGAGYEVLEAASADEALLAMRQRGNEVDLVLTDMVMPGMSGAELARRLVQIKPSLRVIYTSGYSLDVIRNQPLVDVDATILEKPYTLADLTAAVRAVLSPR